MEEEEGGRRVIRTAGSLVWSQKAKEDDEKNGEIGENEEGEVGKRLRRVGHVRQSAGRTPSLGGRVVAAIDRSNRLAPIGIRPPQVEETASHCHVTITAQGKELHGKLCSVSSSQNIVCSGHFLANSPH